MLVSCGLGSEGGGVYYPPRRSWPANVATEVTEGPPCTAAAERFDLGSLIALAA